MMKPLPNYPLSKSDTTENMLLSPAKFWPIHLLFKSIRNVSNTNQKLGLRNNKEEVDKEVGWPDPNPGATQLDLRSDPPGYAHMPLFTVLIRPLRQDMPGCCANRTNATLSCTPVHPWLTAGQLKPVGCKGKQQQRSFCRNKNISQ